MAVIRLEGRGVPFLKLGKLLDGIEVHGADALQPLAKLGDTLGDEFPVRLPFGQGFGEHDGLFLAGGGFGFRDE